MKKIPFLFLALFSLIQVSFSQTGSRGSVAVSESVRDISAFNASAAVNRTTECDTLRYPLQGEIIYYFLVPPGVGYITGNNSYQDKAKAEYFSSFEAGTTISGMVADFAIAKNSGNPQITFAIWNNAGPNGKPGLMVASATKPLSSIVADVTNARATMVTFPQPYTVTGPFYAGVVLPATAGDTLALWCRKHITGYAGTAWEQWSSNAWYPFNHPDSWGETMQTTMTIHPVICEPVGINENKDPEVTVHPNPTTGVVNITLWKGSADISLEVLNISGQKVYARTLPGTLTNFNVDLGFIGKGVYMLLLSDGKRKHSQKLVLQ